MKKDPKIFLQHILQSITGIEKYTKSLSKIKFLADEKTQDAVIRKLEIIGEAVKNLSPYFKKKYTAIEWKELAGMRDILIHEYFGIDLDIVWHTVKKDIPGLKRKLSNILKNII